MTLKFLLERSVSISSVWTASSAGSAFVRSGQGHRLVAKERLEKKTKVDPTQEKRKKRKERKSVRNSIVRMKLGT